MPLPGGPSDKLGNEYERWWTAKVILDLLRADDGVICIEALGEEWSKFEFWVDRNGVREGHQAKRQWGFRGEWTLSSPRPKMLNGVL